MRLLPIKGNPETEKFVCSDGETLEFMDNFEVTWIDGKAYMKDGRLNYE